MYRLNFQKYNVGYHTVLIAKICPYFEGRCPYFQCSSQVTIVTRTNRAMASTQDYETVIRKGLGKSDELLLFLVISLLI